jgi:diadenosine tetraphosphate (Ap4A) HIT family hydrolase
VNDCFVCHKHLNPKNIIGEFIAERSGLVVSHFPFVETEKATRGHLIIEPRRHITDISEMTDAEAAALGGLAREMVLLQKSKLKAEHVYMFRINDKVPHLHFHLIPRYAGTPREFWGLKIGEWPDRPTVGLSEILTLANELRQI